MSQTAPGPGWWLASDGRWYPPELAASPAAMPPPSAPPMGLPPLAFGSGQNAQVQPGVVTTLPPGGMPPGAAGYRTPYPGPIPHWPELPAPKTSRMALWALLLVILLGAVGALAGIPMAFVARSRIRKSGGALKGSGLALAALIVGFTFIGLVLVAIAIPTFLGVTHSGPSIQNLDYSVENQISGAGPTDFHAIDVSAVQCEPPTSWTVGSTFTCVAFGSTGSEVGTYYGTVGPNAPDGTRTWYGRYSPSVTG